MPNAMRDKHQARWAENRQVLPIEETDVACIKGPLGVREEFTTRGTMMPRRTVRSGEEGRCDAMKKASRYGASRHQGIKASRHHGREKRRKGPAGPPDHLRLRLCSHRRDACATSGCRKG
jgi:hypothetical protein